MRKKPKHSALDLPSVSPLEEVLQMLPDKLVQTAAGAAPTKEEFRAAATITAIRRAQRRQGKELRKRYREAPAIACELLALSEAEARRRIALNRGRLHSGALVAELTRCGGRAATEDAEEALRIVRLGREVLERTPTRVRDRYRGRYWLDLRAGLEAERANALRILRRFREARLAFRSARVLAVNGSHDLLLAARLASLMGSYYWDRRKLRAAARAFGFAAETYEALGEEHLLGRTQLNRAALLDYRGSLGPAIDLQREAIGRLDEHAEPLEALAAYANLAEMMQRGGEAGGALSVLALSRPLVEELPECPALGKWYWIRGRCRICAGAPEGEGDLIAAWRILERAGETYDLGLAGVDLCRFYLDHCNLEKLEHWVGPTVRALEPHAPSPLMVRELSKLRSSVERLSLDAARVGQALQRIVETMGRRRSRR